MEGLEGKAGPFKFNGTSLPLSFIYHGDGAKLISPVTVFRPADWANENLSNTN